MKEKTSYDVDVNLLGKPAITHNSQLPSELFFYIFSFIDTEGWRQAAQVSQHFRLVVDDCRAISRGEAKGETLREQYLSLSKSREKKKKTMRDAIELFNLGKYTKVSSLCSFSKITCSFLLKKKMSSLMK